MREKRDIITKDVEKNVRGLVKLIVVDYSLICTQREMIIVDKSPRRCGEEKKAGLSRCSFVV